MAPSDPRMTGRPSALRKYGVVEKGCGWRSGREKLVAIDAWFADKMLMTMSAGEFDGDELREVAMRDGMRRAKVTNGIGSIAIDVNDERVAPWYAGSSGYPVLGKSTRRPA